MSNKKEKQIEKRKNLEKKEREMCSFVEQLEMDGHTCIETFEKYPLEIAWCGEKICKKLEK